MSIRILIVLLAALFAGACSSTLPFNSTEKAFDFRAYFDGPMEAWGVVESRDGEVIRRFYVDLLATWEGDKGELYEKFEYADGGTEVRVWKLQQLPEGRFSGTADDVVGVATGEPYGGSFRWSYVLEVPYRDGTIKVRLDDRLHQVDDQTLVNRAVMKKFGLTVGHITLIFRKPQ
ncbi:MAG: DUF3833 domain-containing protein [Gammaproteobacteria bacterium]|nr:DUF3833 domain-containing protein [Gammaproteobacteria bacterium]